MERMKDGLRLLRDLPRLSADCVWSRGAARALAPDFAGIRRYVEFIGYPCTGHSLVGSLLDAHSQIVMGHELSALRYLSLGFSMPQIYVLLLRSSRSFSDQARIWSGYRYAVAGQWQGGRYAELRVIGDKKGMGATLRLQARPWLLDRLEATAPAPHFIHVRRNLYDSITTYARRTKKTLDQAVDVFFMLLDAVEAQRQRVAPERWFDLTHETFIRDPHGSLRALARFLDVEALQDWLDACASIIFEKPRQPRFEVAWPPELIERVAAQMQASPLLRACEYRFEV